VLPSDDADVSAFLLVEPVVFERDYPAWLPKLVTG
jgi:hypothetical protein